MAGIKFIDLVGAEIAQRAPHMVNDEHQPQWFRSAIQKQHEEFLNYQQEQEQEAAEKERDLDEQDAAVIPVVKVMWDDGKCGAAWGRSVYILEGIELPKEITWGILVKPGVWLPNRVTPTFAPTFLSGHQVIGMLIENNGLREGLDDEEYATKHEELRVWFEGEFHAGCDVAKMLRGSHEEPLAGPSSAVEGSS